MAQLDLTANIESLIVGASIDTTFKLDTTQLAFLFNVRYSVVL